MSASIIEARGLSVDAPGGRPLFCELALSVARERVAIVGRNGSGKSTLLSVLAGEDQPRLGRVIRRGKIVLVEQALSSGTGSPGERRREALERAMGARPDLLLLDEPTQDLDEAGRLWLQDRIAAWTSGLIVVSHDHRILRGFENFFVVRESGCRYVPGSFETLQRELERDRVDKELEYTRHLRRLTDHERKNHRVRQGRRRKKNRGRVNEVDRCPPRIRLNTNRSYAQESQGRRFGQLHGTINAARDYADAARRALTVSLPLSLVPPVLPESLGEIVTIGSLSIGPRDRVGVVGPNGSGKTTLLEQLIARAPSSRTGAIAQGAADWCLDESLLETLSRRHTMRDVADLLVAHRFPLALAERRLSSLSPGERARAALLGCWRRDPPVELLVLDEPTDSLDFTGHAAIVQALRAWPGALVVASHDSEFLASIAVERYVRRK